MSLTDASLQQQIIDEVGDVTTTTHPTGLLKETITIIWGQAQRWRAIPNMQYLTAKRQACHDIITALRSTAVHVRVGDFDEDDSDWVTRLEGISGDLSAIILELYKTTAASRAPVMGAILAVTPQVPPPFQPPNPYAGFIDANDVVYKGDPYATRRRRTGFF